MRPATDVPGASQAAHTARFSEEIEEPQVSAGNPRPARNVTARGFGMRGFEIKRADPVSYDVEPPMWRAEGAGENQREVNE